MNIRRIHSMGQRYFPIPAYIILAILSVYSSYRAITGNFLEWMGTLEACLPFLLLMIRIQVKKDLLRTNRSSIFATVISGCLWSLFYTLYHGTNGVTPILIALISGTIFFIDTYFYNFLDRPAQDKGLEIGKKFPALELKDYHGDTQKLELLLRHPSLILFIRGSWCPLCMAQVKEVAGAYKELNDRGIQIIIITSQKQESSYELAEIHQVPMIYLLDDDHHLAKKLNIIHKNGVPIGLSRSKYGTDTIFPTAIITNENGHVIYVNQTNDITIRPEPSTFLKVFDEYQINHELEVKVQQRTAEVQDLLDNIGEGFFSFSSDYSIKREKSKICDEFFQQDIKYKDPFDLFKSKDKEASKKIVNLVFDGDCPFSLIEELLPKEVQIGAGLFSLRYHWLTNPSDLKKSKVIVVMKNVTRERELAAQFEAEEEFNHIIVRVAIDREGFIQLLSDVKNRLGRLDALLSQSALSLDINEVFRLLHTIKGNVSLFGLKKVSNAAHQIENDLVPVRNNQALLNEELVHVLQGQVNELRQKLEDQVGELRAIISQEELTSTERSFKISESQLSLLSRDLLNQIPKNTWLAVQRKIDDLRKQPIKIALQRLMTLAEDLGRQLEKEVVVKMIGGELAVSHAKIESVLGSLVHLVRNSVDHGLEHPDQRSLMGKPKAGTLTFSASQNGNSLRLFIEDDGRGIDPEVVKEVALKKNIVTPEILDQLSQPELIELIFSPGFSTKIEVSDVSGRGVGMNAVKTAVEKVSGKIKIQTEVGKRTRFEIELPDGI